MFYRKKGVLYEKKYLAALVTTLALSLFVAGCGSDTDKSNSKSAGEQNVTLTLAHIRPVGSPADKAIKEFAAEVEKNTNGSVKFEIHPASELGEYTTVQERVSIGDVDMQIASLGSNMDKFFAVSNTAYLCSNWKEAKQVFAPDGVMAQMYKEKLAKYNLTYLTNYPLYFGGISLHVDPKDPTNPKAKSGIKLRVPSMTTFEKTATTLGYLATPLPSSEMFTSIQTGVVDGAIGAGAEMYQNTLGELNKYYLPINDHFECWWMYINADKWNSLSDKQKEAIQTAANNLNKKRWEVAEAETKEYEQKLRDNGCVVVDYSDDQLKEFADVVRAAVWPAVAEEYGKADFEKIINSVPK